MAALYAEKPIPAWAASAYFDQRNPPADIPAWVDRAVSQGYRSVMLPLDTDQNAAQTLAGLCKAKQLALVAWVDLRVSSSLTKKWLAKPWSTPESEKLIAKLEGWGKALGIGAMVWTPPKLELAWRELDAEGKAGFYGRGNPARLELPLWLGANAKRFLLKLQITLRNDQPNWTLGQTSGEIPDSKLSAISASPEWQPLPARQWLYGKVSDQNGRGLAFVSVSLRDNFGELVAGTQSDAEGWYGLPKLPQLSKAKLLFEYPDVPATVLVLGKADFQNGGQRRDVQISEAAELAGKPWLQIIRPASLPTQAQTVNLIGRTIPGNRLFRLVDLSADQTGGPEIQEEITVLATGAFFLDNLDLGRDGRRIRLKLIDGSGRAALYSVPPKTEEAPSPIDAGEAPPEWIVASPSEDQLCLSGDVLELRLRGPSGWQVQANCFDGKFKLALEEFPDPDQNGLSDYVARLTLPQDSGLPSRAVRFTCSRAKPKRSLQLQSPGSVSLRKRHDPLVAVALNPNTPISWGRHFVRLDGPYAAEVPAGTRFQVTGKIGSRYKIRLSRGLDAWVDAEDVRLLPENTPQPHGYFTFCQASGSADGDRVWMPINAPVPFSVTPIFDEQKGWRLLVDFYNAHLAVTWFSHLESRRLVGFVSGEQLEDDHFRLTIPVAGKALWGYSVESVKGGLWLTIRYPPSLRPRPLEGLTIGLDAGHGGEATGGVGYMGTNEKTINAWFCNELAQVLAEHGAKSALLRPSDYNTSFEQRLKSAEAAHASLILSIHANAGDMSGGYTSMAGPSVYYKYDFSRGPAEAIYQQLLGLFPRGDGIVGNFNFNLLRKTKIPDVLVETGYLTNPVEEALLLDPKFRRREAEAIVNGLEAWLDTLR